MHAIELFFRSALSLSSLGGPVFEAVQFLFKLDLGTQLKGFKNTFKNGQAQSNIRPQNTLPNDQGLNTIKHKNLKPPPRKGGVPPGICHCGLGWGLGAMTWLVPSR